MELVLVWSLMELGGLGQKPGVSPQARTVSIDGDTAFSFAVTSATAAMAMRKVMTAIMVRL